MSKLLEELLLNKLPNIVENTVVKGRIIEKQGKEVLVDIGYKSEGTININEFEDPSSVQTGDEVEVLVENLEDEYGMVSLSREKAAYKKNWNKIVEVFSEGDTIEGKVKEAVKGGLILNVGVEAFLPISQIDVVVPRDLKVYEGKVIECKIVKLNEERHSVILSRRELIEAERATKRSEFLTKVQKGDLVKGVAKNITDFGVFIDLDGIDGLLHITDMSWSRINHPSDLVTVGDTLDLVVTDINREKERISLGLKQKSENPWDKIADKFPINSKVTGKITSLTPYGAFVELEPGIEGLVHVSEISWTKRITRPADILEKGAQIETMVLDVNKADQKISLSMRQLETNPWDEVSEKYPQGTVMKGIVRSFTAYGAFVELATGIDGMIHISDISWTRKINHPSEILTKDEEIEAKVIEIDKINQRISLGLKQLTNDPWSDIDNLYNIGQIVEGKVSKIASFGAFVQITDEIDGLVHISQVSQDRVEKVKELLKVSQVVKARIIKIDKDERRIGLSIKAVDYDEAEFELEREKLESVKPGEELSSMGEAFDKAALKSEPEEYRPSENKKS